MPARCVSFSRLWALTALVLAGAQGIGPTIAAADGEQWVRYHQGAPVGPPDYASALVVHASGEVAIAGTSCDDLLVVRLDREGRVLWSYTEPAEPNYFTQDVHAVPDSEGVFVTFALNFPYHEVDGRLLHLDRHGNRLSSAGAAPVSDAIADGAGGLVIGGTTFTGDLCACPGYIARMDGKGSRIWGDLIGEDPDHWYGDVRRLAADGAGHIFAASEVRGLPGSPAWLLGKYTLVGERRWEIPVLPESTTVTVSAIAAGASDGALAAAGTFTADEWVARYDEEGQLLWSDTWPAAPHPPYSRYPVLLAAATSGITYVATAAGAAGATDIHLAAYEPGGARAWNLTYNSALGAADTPTAITVAPDAAIYILGTDGSHILVLKIDTAGSLIWASLADPAAASGTAFAIDDAGRTVVAGTVAGDDHDFLALEFDVAGASRELARIDGAAMTASTAQGVAVHVGPAGEVTAGIETIYPCIHRFELVGYDALGVTTWTRAIDGFGSGARIGFADLDGTALAAVKRGAAVEVRRYASGGDLDWARSFAATPGWLVEGFAVSAAGEVLLANSVYDSTVVCVIEPSGDERWRRTLTGRHATNPTWGPDGRTYVRSYDGPTIHAFDPNGDLAWTRAIEIGAPLEVETMAAGPGGILYVAGTTEREGRRDWATLGLGPGGDLDWISYEPGTAGAENRPFSAEVLAGGGVAVAGSIRNGLLAVRYGDGGTAAWRTWTSIAGFVCDLAGDRLGNLLLLIQNGPWARTIKINAEGDVVWDRRFAGSIPWSYEQKIAVGADLSVAVTGEAGGDSAFALKYTDLVPVEIATLRADRRGADVELRWDVGAGFDAAGWLVSYSTERVGAYQPLTPEWLPSSARSFVHHGAPREAVHYVLDVLHPDGGVTRHGPVVTTPAGNAPPAFWARPPSPNPASTEVTWQFGIPAATPVHLVVHDTAGRIVARIVAATLPAGVHAVRWDGRLPGGKVLPSGIYAYRLETARGARTGKLVWMR